MRRPSSALLAAALLSACAPVDETPDAGTVVDAPVDAGDGCPSGSHATEGGCDSTISWADGPELPAARDHHASFAVETPVGRFLYVAGGAPNRSGATVETTLRARIGDDGVPGEWESQAPLLDPTAGPGVAVRGRTVLVTGGLSNGFYLSATFVSHVADDGTLEEWSYGPTLPTGSFHHAVAQHGRWAYVTGGLRGTDNLVDVSRAELRDDGTVGDFVAMTPLPAKRSHHAAFVFGDRLYVAGGLRGNPAGNPTTLDDVLSAPIAADGTLGEWTRTASLAAKVAAHGVLVRDGRLWLFGGIERNADFVDRVRRAPLLADGALGAWEGATRLPVGRGHVHQVPMLGDFAYSIGGSTPTSLVRETRIAHFE